MKVLATHHIAIFTRDSGRLEEFYTQKLGFAVTKRWDDANIIFIDIGSTTIELIGRQELEGEDRPHSMGRGVGINHIALHVADTDAVFRELVENGVQTLAEPSDLQDVRIAFFADPDGNVLELVQQK